jgi:hypothetical protein
MSYFLPLSYDTATRSVCLLCVCEIYTCIPQFARAHFEAINYSSDDRFLLRPFLFIHHII